MKRSEVKQKKGGSSIFTVMGSRAIPQPLEGVGAVSQCEGMVNVFEHVFWKGCSCLVGHCM